MQYDVIIIGAGLSGMAAGVRLADMGKRVLLIEAHTVCGGMNSYYNHAGRTIDVGLHAITDFAEPRQRTARLNRLFRQLGLNRKDIPLAPQVMSKIQFPGHSLHFSNDIQVLQHSIAREFPAEQKGFEEFNQLIQEFTPAADTTDELRVRDVIRRYIRDPELIDMLTLPLSLYGCGLGMNASLQDLALRWQSIYQSGLCRPEGGMLRLVTALLDRYESAGGTVLNGQAVARILTDNNRVSGIVLRNGRSYEADLILSCAGLRETLELCHGTAKELPPAGNCSLIEFAGFLDCMPADLNISESVVFFSTRKTFSSQPPPNDLADYSCGMLCFPNNFEYRTPLDEGMVRLTLRAACAPWLALDDRLDYREAKVQAQAKLLKLAARLLPDIRPHLDYFELITPITLRRFTRHANGSTNGVDGKCRDGCSGVENLIICGIDQGYSGIVGAMYSGLLMADRHGLNLSRA